MQVGSSDPAMPPLHQSASSSMLPPPPLWNPWKSIGAQPGPSPPAVPGYVAPSAPPVNDPSPQLALRVVCAQYEQGDLFLLADQRVKVHARSTQLINFRFDDGLSADVELTDDSPDSHNGGAAFVTVLPLAPSLVGPGSLLERLLGQPAERLTQMLSSQDKALRKVAKAGAKAANTHFVGLEGLFILGGGAGGLTVHSVPDGPPGGGSGLDVEERY